MSYFSQMGNVWYTLDDGTKVLLNDITAFAALDPTWSEDARVQIPYQVRDGELPHMISLRLYGSVEYWWTILKINQIGDFENQWPRSTEQLNNYIAAKYPNNQRTDVHHYLNPQGLVTDPLALRLEYGYATDADAIDGEVLTPITIEEYEIACNEVKRNIKLIDPDYIESVKREYDKAMEGTE